MKVLLAFCLMFLAAWLPLTGLAQTTEFTYQGQLTDSGAPQASYQLRFRLFDALVGGSQIGSTIENASVAVDDGIFSVSLDFGANPFPGADRFIEIAVRRNSGESYTVLSPRQQIASSPYAIRTLSAQTADLALDSEKLGGLDANEYVTNTTVGSAFVRNGTMLQDADFNIDGSGFVGATLGIGTTAPGSGLELRGTGFNAQQRITDAASGNSLVLQSGSGSSMKVTGWNYNTSTAQPLYLSTDGAHTFLNPSGGLVGIGMTSPTHALDVHGFFRASHVAGGNVVSETTGGVNSWAKLWMLTPVQSWSIGSSHNFNDNQLYFSNENAGGGIRMAIMPNGNVGIGTTAPGARLAVSTNTNSAGNNTAYFEAPTIGPNASNIHFGTTGDWYIRSASASGKVILQDTGGNVGIGTSNPNAKLSLVGSATQDVNSRGFPKAMVWSRADGLILECYNGTNGSTSSGCGFSVNRFTNGGYGINFGFSVVDRIVSVTAGRSTTSCFNRGANYEFAGPAFPNNIDVFTFCADEPDSTTDGHFMIIVY